MNDAIREEALRLLSAEDERQSKLHDLLETIREQIRLEIPPEHRPSGLFTNIQNAVYAMRGRTLLMNDAAITAALSAPQADAGADQPLTPRHFLDDIMSACDPSNWDAERNKGEYFRGLNDAYEAIHEIASEYQVSIYAWCKATPPPSQAADRMRDETGWLIEMEDPPVYHFVTTDHDEHWTPDAGKAIRFARREDAQAYSDHVGWTSPPVRIVEHMWPVVSRADDGKKSEGGELPANLAEIIETELTAWRGANGGVYTIHAAALGISCAIRSAIFRATNMKSEDGR